MGQLPTGAKQLINDVIAGRREKRKRPKWIFWPVSL
jgi:hypothetical protein